MRVRPEARRYRSLGWAPLAMLLCMAVDVAADDRIIAVGPTRAVPTIAQAAAMARDGDTFEIDAGDYVGDVAIWTKDRVVVRAVGGRVRLVAAGASAERKAIWVVRGGSVLVDGLDFIGARVPDRNGAGIRFEKGRLTIRNCGFFDNENGILAGNDKEAALTIENSEFGHNGAGDGQSHNLYAGGIGELRVVGSYFHHARVGHLLKSRAASNYVAYNRLTDETGGQASYELEFPAGGVAIVVGNIIQQSATTQNPFLVAFGAEGYRWPRNELYLVHNTLIDNRPREGRLLRVRPGAGRVLAVNNLAHSGATFDEAGPGEFSGNASVPSADFAAAGRHDYRLKRRATIAGELDTIPQIEGVSLAPDSEYAHPRTTRRLVRPPRVPGALQSRAD